MSKSRVSKTDAPTALPVTDLLTAHYRFPTDEPISSDRLRNGLAVRTPVLVDAVLPGHPRMRIRFEVEAGKLVITRLELLRDEGEPAISAAAVNDLPLAPVLRAIRTRLVTAFSIIDQLGERALTGPPSPGSERASPASDLPRAGPAQVRARPSGL
ncbi:MAG: hypothetical protein JWO62_3040 [Acidimicrobiaceae bacterium]|nr:hypothetical protein [Acidimicrobiaceae bacterium]